MMAYQKPKKQETWIASLERPRFNISESHPISAFHHRWNTKNNLRYDMHYGLELGILLKGKIRRIFDTTSFDVASGETWLCGMWEPHGYQITQVPCEAVVLIIFPPVLARAHIGQKNDLRLLSPFDATPSSRPTIPPSFKKKILRMAEDIKSITNSKSKNKDVWLNLKLTEILLILTENWDAPKIAYEKYSYPTATISKAIKLVFKNKDFISTQKAAKICGINRNAFGKIFRETMGITFSEFGLRYRISAVAELLGSTDKPLKAIASEWGFTDVSHMHRCIKKYYNRSPTEYRKSKIKET